MNEIARNTEGEGTFLQVRKIGNSLGLILSKELLAACALRRVISSMSSNRPNAA